MHSLKIETGDVAIGGNGSFCTRIGADYLMTTNSDSSKSHGTAIIQRLRLVEPLTQAWVHTPKQALLRLKCKQTASEKRIFSPLGVWFASYGGDI